MRRRFRLLQKKLRHRRSGSPVVANVGEGLYFFVMLAIGFFSVTALITSRVVDIPGFSELTTGSRFWVGLLVLGSLAVIGAGGLARTVYRVSTSAERRSAIARQAVELQKKFENWPSGDFPTVPRNENLYNSPGTRLTYRLPQTAEPTWSLLALGLFCLMWLGLLASVLVVVTKSFLSGQPRWGLLLVVFLLAVFTVRVCQSFLIRLREAIRIGPTHVEIAVLPLYPGETCRVRLSQFGRMTLTTIRVLLVCDEQATFRDGTNVRTERRRVVAKSVFEKHAVEVTPNEPYSQELTLEMPHGAMHTFKSDSNSITWKLVVTGELFVGLEFEREYPVVVYPRVVTEQAA